MEFSHSSGVTVTQDSCNVFPLSSSGHSTLILSFESWLTHSHNNRLQTATHFFRFLFLDIILIFKVELFRSLCVIDTEGPCHIS